jgi:formamidopyrimidine-DNA glycosylase
MPELPEVEITRRSLVRWMEGRRVDRVEVPDPAAIRSTRSTLPSDAHPDGVAAVRARVEGGRLVEARRHGKRLGLRFDAGDLLVHLGMTGRFTRGPADRFVRVCLHLDDGSAVRFVDSRRFGCLVPTDDLDADLAEGLGPDVLLAPPDARGLGERLRGRRSVKAALMDQAVVAGLGNIHAVEALWRARLHPDLPCDRLGPADLVALAGAIALQVRWAVDLEDGEEVAYVTEGAPNPFTVYGRAGGPCPRCGALVERTTGSGRATYACRGCQRA